MHDLHREKEREGREGGERERQIMEGKGANAKERLKAEKVK